MKIKISYTKLIVKLHDRNLKLSNLLKECGLSTNLTTTINNDEPMSLVSLMKIALYLNCKLDDLVHFKEDSVAIKTF